MLGNPKRPRTTKRRGRHPDRAPSAAFCPNVAEAGRYCDGNGLYLEVDPTGARRWVQRLVIRGKSRTLGLGGFAPRPARRGISRADATAVWTVPGSRIRALDRTRIPTAARSCGSSRSLERLPRCAVFVRNRCHGVDRIVSPVSETGSQRAVVDSEQ